MLSEGDPPTASPSMKGKTTKKRTKSASDKKLPSYRQPPHTNALSEIVGENSLFNILTDESTKILKPIGSLGVEKSNEMGNFDTATDANLEAGEDQNDSDHEDEAGNEDEGEGAKRSEESEEDRDGDPNQADGEEEGQSGSEEDQTSEDLAGNVLALKDNVDGVQLNLKNAAETSMVDASAELDTEMEGRKSEISTLLRPITDRYFPDDSTLKLEELVYDQLSESILTTMHDQVDIFLAEASGDIDEVVADKEEEGMVLIEITGYLDEWESEKVTEIQEEVTKIANGLKETLAYAVPDKAQETVEKVFEKLQRTVTLKLNNYGQLTMDPQIDVDFSEEEAAGAILQVFAEDDDSKDEDGEKELDESESEIGVGEEEQSEDGNEEGQEGEEKADESNEDEGELPEAEDGNEDFESGQGMGGSSSRVNDSAQGEEQQNIQVEQGEQGEQWQLEQPQVEGAGNTTGEEWQNMNQLGQGQEDVNFGNNTHQGAEGGDADGEANSQGGENSWENTQLTAEGGGADQEIDQANMDGGIEDAAENEGDNKENGDVNTEGGEAVGEDIGQVAGENEQPVEQNVDGGEESDNKENEEVNTEGGEAVGEDIGQAAGENEQPVVQNLDGGEENEQVVNVDGGEEIEQADKVGGGEETGSENTGEGGEGTEQAAEGGGDGDKEESNSGDDDDEEAD